MLWWQSIFRKSNPIVGLTIMKKKSETTLSTGVTQLAESTIGLQDWLRQLASIDYTDSDFLSLIADSRLAALYTQLEQQRKWVHDLQAFTDINSEIVDAGNNLQRIVNCIHKFYANYLKKNWIGEEMAWQYPDIIVILGAHRALLEQRLAFALTIIRKNPAVPIILSGGGRTYELEAGIMLDFLQKNNVMNPMVMETDSLDTVGNAVFTDFKLKENNITGKSILIITSSFHGPISLFLFQKILSSDYNLAVALAPYDAEDFRVKIDHELRQQAIINDTLLHWEALPGQAQSRPVHNSYDVLYQMFTHHELYLARWDLARKYIELCHSGMKKDKNIPPACITDH